MKFVIFNHFYPCPKLPRHHFCAGQFWKVEIHNKMHQNIILESPLVSSISFFRKNYFPLLYVKYTSLKVGYLMNTVFKFLLLQNENGYRMAIILNAVCIMVHLLWAIVYCWKMHGIFYSAHSPNLPHQS